MKYNLQLESPDMMALLAAAEARVTHLRQHHVFMRQRYGKGHTITVDIGQQVNRTIRARDSLLQAIRDAVPEHATGTFEGAIQVGDELTLVYGRPRNDPRAPRVKTSNQRRKATTP